jgi:HD-GYP domain-containing protein (c-di-GMP phosphodiesterase class II)
VFAALVEPRPYKRAIPPRDAIARMLQLAGKLDPACLAALGRLIVQADPSVVEMAADGERSS